MELKAGDWINDIRGDIAFVTNIRADHADYIGVVECQRLAGEGQLANSLRSIVQLTGRII